MVTKVIAIAILVFTALTQKRLPTRRGKLLYESRCVGCRSVDHNRSDPCITVAWSGARRAV